MPLSKNAFALCAGGYVLAVLILLSDSEFIIQMMLTIGAVVFGVGMYLNWLESIHGSKKKPAQKKPGHDTI